LTFAFRQAVFALAEMEEILVESETSHIREILDKRMLDNPQYWQKHYSGSPRQQQISRFYSFSDRIRYYWTDSEVQTTFERLMNNLGITELPLSLVSEYLPRQYEKIRDGKIKNLAHILLLDRITDVLNDYAFACGNYPL
jgi:D-tagatose-1,6-bisphosphate aldolase subunit GatZ/KbaZ